MREHLGAASAKLAATIARTCAFALLLGTACGQAAGSQPASGQAFPVTIHESDGRTVTIAKQPHRVISLSATATEMLFAIGAGKQVVAVDDQSDYPASAPKTKLSGFEPNVEAVAGYTPDLVVISDDIGGLVKGLTALNIATLLEPAVKDLNGSYAQIHELGTATGHVPEADTLAGRMRSQVASILATVARPARQPTVYHELDQTYYSASSHTFIGQVYTMLGLKNIADKAGSQPDYPQLSSEYIVSASPDLIVLADSRCCQQDAKTVAARPGWSGIAAVRNGEVVPVDDAIASRWGPRIVDFMRALAPRVAQLEHQPAA